MFAKRSIHLGVAVLALGTTLSAAGGKLTGGGVTGTEVTMRVPNETVPAGAMVQMKVMTTEVTPISGGRPSMGYDPSVFSSVAGFGIEAPNGEIGGAAVISGNHVQIFYTGTSTLTANYPILTVVQAIRSDVPVGTKTLWAPDATSVWNYASTGPVTARIAPATVTVGGDVAINDVIPGEGVWPSGTIVTVEGVGFDAKTSLRVNDAGVTNWWVVSPTELQFALTTSTNVRGLKITVSGKNSVDYYAYMRGITAVTSARTLLSTTEPIFSVNARTVSTFGPIAALAGNQYNGLALQNPNLVPVSVSISLVNTDGTLNYASSRTLQARNRLALEMSELLDGVVPPAGSSVVVSSSLPIDAFGLRVDEGLWTVDPFLPHESQLP
jgi:hypothetical protein